MCEEEITPSKTAEEDCRVCDLCIQVIDEKLAEGLSKRFGKSAGIPVEANENDDSSNKAAPLPASKSASRTVLTVGRYRCVSLSVLLPGCCCAIAHESC